MVLNHSQKAKRGTSVRPRPLVQSEIDSLRRDAISTSTSMKQLIAERRRRQAKVMVKLMDDGLVLEAAE